MPADTALLDWVARSLSFFDAIAMLWLGLTVVFNAERRSWGTAVISAGFLLGGLFFVGHTAVVGDAAGALNPQIEIWGRGVWILFISHPYMWYLAIAWYTGGLRSRRDRVEMAVISILGVAAMALLFAGNPLPSYGEIVQRSAARIPVIAGLPLVVVYPLFSAVCFVLTLGMLSRPGVSDRFMGDVAGERARPWLRGASFMLLGVTLTVGSMAAWFLQSLQTQELTLLSPAILRTLTVFDLVISAELAAVIVMLGQAIVAYELFTGRVLPRGGLVRHWRNTLFLAGGYGALMSASLGLPIDPIYHLLLATVLMAILYALLTWRSYFEREQSIERLRPFVASQRLFEHLLTPSAPLDTDIDAPFQALCNDMLGARVAYLAVLGPLAPLLGQGFAYPREAALPGLAGLADPIGSPQTLCVRLDPSRYGGADLGVALWNDRGLAGALLLGEKRDGRLYAQEEIEIARGACERLIDSQASAEIARRLMALQRRRLAEGQVIDQSVRRALHDEVLPDLHAALLALGGAGSAATEGVRDAVILLSGAHRRIAGLMEAMPAATAPEVARLGLVGALRLAVENGLGSSFDSVTWRIDQETEGRARGIPELSAQVVFFAAREAVRNAGRHGRGPDPTAPLHLTVSAGCDGTLRLSVEDDGAGLEWRSGAAEIGAGHGLALHSTMMAVIGGTLTVETTPTGGARVSLALPVEEL